jgi:hypothetical protein
MMIDAGVFPSILWKLSWWRSDRAARLLSERLLTVPCDWRLGSEERAHVASILSSHH